MNLTLNDLKIDQLGERKYKSPIYHEEGEQFSLLSFETDQGRVLFSNSIDSEGRGPCDQEEILSFEKAGPREELFFDPTKASCGIVTCGGLCPGMNNVIRSLVMRLHYGYGVKKILGFKYGFQGLVTDYNIPPIKLTPDVVKFIHERGGTFLGSSRGNQDEKKIVNTLEKYKINCLFTIGGDGTFRATEKIYHEIKRRGLDISIVGIPKTIDNDINFVQKTFGFETAYSEAAEFISRAHVEANDAHNGVAIVKVMGRHSGFIAASATLALREVNLVLVPEQPFSLEKVLKLTQDRLEKRGHSLIVVAEGAGQHLMDIGPDEKDLSGNVKLKDIGIFLRDKIKHHFKEKSFPLVLKYIDPSYLIRSAPANPGDAVFTSYLGPFAADAAMAGKTGLAIGYWNGWFTHVPINLTVSERKDIDPKSGLWRSVLKSTGQPANMME